MTSVASQGALVGRGSSDTERIAIYGTGRPSLKPSEPPNAGKYGFNFKFVGGLWRLVRFATKWDLLVVGFLLGLIIANLYVGSQSGNVTGQFYNVIVDKNEQQFKKVLWQATIVIILSALLESAIKLVLDLIAFRWRKLLVQKLHHRYFSRSMFYQILHLDHTIDNPYVPYFNEDGLCNCTVSLIFHITLSYH